MSITAENIRSIKFNHEEKIQIRFNDVDLLGHVNNAVQLYYYDYGKVKYFEVLKHSQMEWDKADLVIVNLNIDFLFPIFMNDDIRVKTKIYEIGHKSVKLIQELYDEKTKMVKSICNATMCGFDPKTNTSVVISDEWRNMISAYEQDVKIKSVAIARV